jgi:thioredoxin 1
MTARLCPARHAPIPLLDQIESLPILYGTHQEIRAVTTAITDDNFETAVLKSELPVLVDFWAEWCAPCRAIAPILEDVQRDKGDKLTVAKLNIDENPGVPTKYGVRGIPTLMLFKGGQLAATKIGALPKGALYDWIDSVL